MTIKGYEYECSCCKFRQIVYSSGRRKPKKTINGFCAKDKNHKRTKFTLTEASR